MPLTVRPASAPLGWRWIQRAVYSWRATERTWARSSWLCGRTASRWIRRRPKSWNFSRSRSRCRLLGCAKICGSNMVMCLYGVQNGRIRCYFCVFSFSALALTRLPKDLKKTFSEILRVEEQSNDSKILAEKTLKFILCAQQPPSPDEVAEFLCFDPMNRRLKTTISTRWSSSTSARTSW